MLQRGRPPRRAGSRRAAGVDLRQPGHRHRPHLHVPRAAKRGRAVRRRAGPGGRCARGPGDRLHADGPRGGDRHAGLRAAGGDSLGRIRRLRRRRAGGPHRRLGRPHRRVRLVRDTGGQAGALKWSMDAVFDAAPGETYWAASDIGWVVGHSYIVYAPLLHGCATVLYEGKPVGTPDAGAFWRVCAKHGVSTMFTAPTAIRAVKREDPHGSHIDQHDLRALRTLFLAGERCDPDTLMWAQSRLERPVIDHWWQTESGWPMAANCVGLGLLPVKAGSPTKPVPGYDIRILDEAGDELTPGQTGAVCVKLPLPPGFAPTLWRGEDRFVDAYLSRYGGFYLSGDAGYLDDDGYLYVMSRIDDDISVAGHRLSTGQLEEVLAAHPDVAECAVVGVADTYRGQLPVGFAVLKAGVDRTPEELAAELVKLVRDRVGPVAALKTVAIVDALPKTRSGKTLRATIRKIADGEEWTVPPTIEDPSVLDEFARLLPGLMTTAQR